jgi:hypothetical protein
MALLAIGRGMGHPISWCRREPTITEMLSDSMVIAMMAADRVDPVALEAQLRATATATAARRMAGCHQTG